MVFPVDGGRKENDPFLKKQSDLSQQLSVRHGKSVTSNRIVVVEVEVASQARPCSDIAFASSRIVVCKNGAATQSLMATLEYGSAPYTP